MPIDVKEAIKALGKDNLQKDHNTATPGLNGDEEGIQNLQSRGSSNDIQEPIE